jgi:endonuclease III
MAEQYVASENRTGLEVAVKGEFPPHPDDRVRIARTTNLFTQLMATILSTGNETERRQLFISLESALEIADALARQDMEAVNQLIQQFFTRHGLTPEQLQEMLRELGMPPRPPQDDEPSV